MEEGGVENEGFRSISVPLAIVFENTILRGEALRGRELANEFREGE